MTPGFRVGVCAIVLWSVVHVRAHDAKTIPDVAVVNQDGRTVHFYSDVIKASPIVLVTFIFTTCDGICPMQGAALARLQATLGSRVSREVGVVAVSVDPETDTPERLKAWGARFGAGSGWTLVTGDRSNIDRVAKALTGANAEKGEHSPVVFIGSSQTGKWIRVYGLSSPERFERYIDEVRRAGD